jgi:putative protease
MAWPGYSKRFFSKKHDNTMTPLELLCPAKDYKTGVAAVMHGADAVYIAAARFGAREKAGNSLLDIERLVHFAHQYYVRVYVTVNTIIYENELAEVQGLITDLYKIGVDAIIVQDMGILEMDIPPIPIFASTQAHSATLEKVLFLERVGVSRVILARELSLREIRHIRNHTRVDLEFFVHGALCVCYSGQCYLSHYLTGRSANRGACAQPCRSVYSLVNEQGNTLAKNKYLLSLKDLNLSHHLADLVEAGITSFKIEGRLKDINYVKNITAYYSQLLNSIVGRNVGFRRASSGICTYSFAPDPERSFNRGFTPHFVAGRKGGQSSMVTQKSIGKPVGRVKTISDASFTIESDLTLHNGDGLCFLSDSGTLTGFLVNRVENTTIYPNQPLPDLRKGLMLYRNQDHQFEKNLQGDSARRKVRVDMEVAATDNGYRFKAKDEDANESTVEIDEFFPLASSPAKALEAIASQLSKTGDTIFAAHSVVVNLPNPPFMPMSRINELRRTLLEKLLDVRLKNYPRLEAKRSPGIAKYPDDGLTYKANVSNSLAQKFYHSRGVKAIDPAFEINLGKDNAELMVSKYCVKFELGMCPVKQNAKPTGRLFLSDGKNTYPLIFDCNECVMKVMSPQKSK